LLCVGAYLKKINKTVFVVNKIGDSFSQYAALASLIESNEFEHPFLKKKIKVLLEDGGASSLLRKFSKRLDAVNNRNNLLIGLFGNALFLYDYRSIYKMEKWIGLYKDKTEAWFEAIHFLDGWNSLGAFAYNHDEFIFPEIVTDEKELITASKLAHPMIKKEVRVPSDFRLGGDDFTIVTGANMAGKSTFLRTIALSTIMSNMGLPVCATSFTYRPVKLISSMRTSDSLHEDESFFFSELKRLRFVVDHIEKEEYLILLDEILKGTNSVDKANGSAKFIEKLLKTSSAGIIATHDLSLCDLSDKYEQVKNKCFEAQIENDELTFDYKLKKGICQNMNASFLLKKMNLVD
jgi:DNA mismatch repair ATPase MutS